MGGSLADMDGPCKPRAGIYCRISRDAEGEALGVARQEEDCRKLADRLGWEVAEVFVDNDTGASRHSRKKRPRYQDLLRAVDEGRLSAILAYSTSRLTRRPREFEDIIDRVEKGLKIATANTSGQVDLSTADGQAMARTLAAFDAREAGNTAERVRRKKLDQKAKGEFIGGPRAFGWKSRYTEPEPGEAALIVAASRDVLSGLSLAGIAQTWQAATGGTPGGKKWGPTGVRAVLTNPRHAGLTRHEVPAPHPGILEPAEWRGLVAALDDPARKVRTPSVGVHLLTGFAHCGKCGASVHSGSSGANLAGQRLYRCTASAHLARQAAVVDEYVSSEVVRRLGTPDAARWLTESSDADTAALETRRAALRARLANLADLVADGTLTAADVRATAPRLRAELAEAEAQMAEAGRADVLGPLVHADDVQAVWDGLGLERQRVVLRSILADVILRGPGKGPVRFRPETVVILWNPVTSEEVGRTVGRHHAGS